MTMNYCGRCGAANGTAARYCRQCGVELHNQAAFSSGTSPLNVEFSARNAQKDRAREVPPPPTPPPYPTAKTTTVSSDKEDDEVKDPKAISESLKKLRASGPLTETAKDKKKQERINQIIDSSVESKREKKRGAKSQSMVPVPKAPSQAKTKNTRPLAPASSEAVTPPSAPAANRKNSVSTQSANSPAVIGAYGTSNASGSFMAATSRNSGALTGMAQLPPNGPSSVLAQASGLGKQSNMGSRFRIGVIALVVLLAAGGYFLLRDKLTGPARLMDSGRNLLSAEEQSAYLVRLGQRDREQGHSEASIGYFQNALALTPNNPDVLFMLAQTYAGIGQSDEAMKSYQSLLRIMPEQLEARLQVAEIHRQRGNWNAALQEYQRIITLDQNSPQAAVALSVMESQNSGKPEIADATLRRPRPVTKKTPVALPGTLAQTNVMLPQAGMAAAGIKPPTFNNRPEEKPDPRVAADSHKKLGLRYFNVRQYRAAINEFLSALRLTPEDKDIYYFLGSSYYGLSEFAMAHDYYRRVDSGNYIGVAQSGAARTEKAAREEAKRRELLKNDSQNQVKNDVTPKSKGNLNNSFE